MRTLLERTLFVPVALVRPYLVLKGTLLLLALDMWLTRIEHGGRYGAGGFNVANFTVLDSIQPTVSPDLYIGVCVLTGFLCFAIAIAPRAPRWLVAVALLLHTWSWAMSMLDSYQHHYLLSLVLLALVFFPRVTAEEALLSPKTAPPSEPAPAPPEAKKAQKRKQKKAQKKEKKLEKKLEKRETQESLGEWLSAPPPMRSAWAYVALAVSVAIVYGYTAYSKSASEWLSGAAFRRVLRLQPDGTAPNGVDDYIAPLRGIASVFGIEGESFWWMMGHSVVLVQMICCAGYLLAPFADVTKNRVIKAFMFVALFTALSFHFGAEYMELKIGWFSWYMVGYALVFMLPGRWLAAAGRVLFSLGPAPFPTERTAARIGAAAAVGLGAFVFKPLLVLGAAALSPLRAFVHADRGVLARVPSWAFLVTAVIGAQALVWAGHEIDLPGALDASTVAACGLAVLVVLYFVKVTGARTVHAYGVAAALAALVFYVSVVLSPVRYDFYRNVGGDHRRRGELATAYVAYVKANRYAPEGEGRQDKERELRRILEASGDLPRIDE